MKVTRSVIPNLFTIINLFCGFASIVHSINHEFGMAAIMIVLGGAFDGLDGLMARLTRSASEFGVELDSLADVVTFGLAPAVMVYLLYFHAIDPPGMLLAALPAICGALRLARFNVQLVGFDKNYFRGLPIPAAALTIVSFVYFDYFASTAAAQHGNDIALGAITVITSLLMVSTIKYDALPKFTRNGIATHPMQFAVFVFALSLVVATLGKALFPLSAAYIIFGIVRSAVSAFRRRAATEEFEEDENDSVQEIV